MNMYVTHNNETLNHIHICLNAKDNIVWRIVLFYLIYEQVKIIILQ